MNRRDFFNPPASAKTWGIDCPPHFWCKSHVSGGRTIENWGILWSECAECGFQWPFGMLDKWDMEVIYGTIAVDAWRKTKEDGK